VRLTAEGGFVDQEIMGENPSAWNSFWIKCDFTCSDGSFIL